MKRLLVTYEIKFTHQDINNMFDVDLELLKHFTRLLNYVERETDTIWLLKEVLLKDEEVK